MTRMSASEAFVETLAAQGVTHVFGIVGSAYMDALDLFPAAGIRFVSVAHEQGAGHMADGFSRKLHNTLLVERADLMRMADVVMTEIELATGRPTLEAGERAMLDDLASIPLNMWQKWLDRLQETQKKNEALRSERQDEIDAANHATAAAEALAKLATGQKVEGDEALRAAKSGSNQRSNQRPKSSVH